MGFAQFMVSSMKSNSRRQQRTPFDKESIYLSNSKKNKKPQFKKATKEQLLRIRNRMKENNNAYQQKLVGYTCLSILCVSIILYFSNNIISFIF